MTTFSGQSYPVDYGAFPAGVADALLAPRGRYASGGLRESSSPSTGTLEDRQPIAGFPATTVPGVRAASFFDDFYNRIYFYPTAIDFGAVTDDTSRTLTIWNAYLRPATLENITADNAEGTAIVGPDIPATLAAFGSYDFEVRADADGPAVIQATYSFNFGADGTLDFQLAGNRAQLWPFAPDWSDSYSVVYEFQTDIFTSHSGREQRRSLRQTPRKRLEHRVLLRNKEQLRRYNRLAATWQHRGWVCPERTRSTRVTAGMAAGGDTVTVDALPDWIVPKATVVIGEGDRLALRVVENVEGYNITFSAPAEDAWPSGTTIYPGLTGNLAASLEAPRRTSHVAELSFRFDVTPGSEAAPPLREPSRELDFREVFIKRPNWIDNVAVTNEHEVNTIDFGFGVTTRYAPIEFGTIIRQATYTNFDRDAATELEHFFRRQRGQAGEFYAPTWENDMDVRQLLANGTTSLRVVGHEVFDAYAEDPVHRAVMLLLRDGSLVANTIVGMSKVEDLIGADTVAEVGHPWPADIEPATVVMVSWMPVSRLASDTLTLEWVSSTVAKTKLSTRTLENLEEEVE